MRLLIYICFSYFAFLYSCLAQNEEKGEVQSDCSVKLQESENAFEDGSLSNSILLLKDCLEKGDFNKEERVRAYRLLAIIHLYRNQDKEAEEFMHQLLRTNPEYRLRPNDPAEFVELYRKFRIRPYLIVGGNAGANLSQIRVTQLFSTDNPANQEIIYTNLLGFQFGGIISRPITNFIEILLQPNLVSYRYRFEAQYFGFARLLATETQIRFDLPLILKYNFKNKYNFNLLGIKPYVMAGATPHFLISASFNAQRNDINQDGDVERSVEGKAISMKELRNSLTFSVLAGIGVEYKIGLGHLFVELRYQAGLNNMVKSVNRYILQEEIARYGFLDNDYTLSAIMLSLGYNYPLYNPKIQKRKLKKVSEDIKIENLDK
jgi:hypothetical protein